MKLQSFKCHKVVQAAAILSITIKPSNVFIVLESEPEVEHPIDPEVFARSVPEKGDYLVRYEDGYISFSPKDVFEAGYSINYPEWLERVILEKDTLDLKISKLSKFIDSSMGDVVETAHNPILNLQLDAMNAYSAVLNKRIGISG